MIPKISEPKIPEFLARPPETPLLDDTWKAVVKSIDDMINGAIYAVGDKFGGVLNALKEVKGPIVSLGGGNSLAADPSSTQSLSPPNSPSIQQQGDSPKQAQSIGKELQVAMEKFEPSNLAQGLKCENCNMQESGLLASPYTPSTGVNRSQGIGIG